MLKFLLCLVCGVTPVSATLLSSVYHKLQESETQGQHVCEVSAKLKDCHPPMDSLSSLARPGTVCQDDTWYLQCHTNGEWELYTEAMDNQLEKLYFKKNGHRREKRFLFGLFVGAVVCFFLCGGSGGSNPPPPQPPPNKPPTVICPFIGTQRPTEGTSMIVTWIQPEGSDEEDGTLSATLNGPDPGSVFEEGTYMISYHVTDSGGLTATCYSTFTVKSYHCTDLRWPGDGTRSCTNRFISGSTCTISCDEGYEVQGESSVTCNEEMWSGTIGQCTAKTCGPTPDITDGDLACFGDLTFNTYCQLTCDEGFRRDGILTSKCNANEEWTQTGTCKDATRPVFPFGCPVDIADYAEKQNQPKVVTWSDPQVNDNKGNVTITYKPTNGSLFPVGQTTVYVEATDENDNSNGCTFRVQINTLHCQEPDLGDDKLIFDCPDGFGQGYSCSPSCRGNFPIAGSSSILCEKDVSTFPPTASWTWPDDSLKPFCKNATCPTLPPPINGAIACDGWTYGLICVMNCNEQYDVPSNVPETYTCGEQTGLWFPNDQVHDCTVIRLAGEMTLANEFYYYSGSCEDEATRQTIAENFITILTNNAGFVGVCGDSEPNCRAEFVSVRCGATSNRKRRSVEKRESHFIAVKFKIDKELSVRTGETFATARTRVEESFNGAIAAIQTMTESGELNMPDMGLTVQPDSYKRGYPKIKCQEGVPDNEKGSCRGCPKGTFTEESGNCMDCPIGTYSDVEFATKCTSCDEGMSTKSTGSKSADNCTDLCPAGSSSSDGMRPCSDCDVGTFADTIGSTKCTSCSDSTTSLQGAATCVPFDLMVVPDSEDLVGEVTSDMTSATLTFWFNTDTPNCHVSLMLKSPEGNTIVGLSVINTLHIDTFGNSVDTGATPKCNQWQHVTLTFDGITKELVLYLLGVEVYRGTDTSLGNPAVPDKSSVRSTAATEHSFLLSGINIFDRVISHQEVQSMAASCLSSINNSLLIFFKSGKKLIAPSLCDAVDNCKESPCSSQPPLSHPCEDRIGTFYCDCQDGWTGTRCEIPPDFCAYHKCQNNANCENDLTNYTCKCQKGFRGPFCQYEIVNGKWSDWTKWTICSKSCDGGSQSRSRVCDNPPPDEDGDDCEGEMEEVRACNPQNCPECPELNVPNGNKKVCWEEEGLQICNVTCHNGMKLTRKNYQLSRYECGAASKYIWNHQKSGVNHGRIPQCSKAIEATSYSAIHTVHYPRISCKDGENEENEIHSQVSDNISYLPCVKDDSCQATVQRKPCDDSADRKRAIEPTVISITLTTEMDISISDDIEVFDENGTVTDKLKAYVERVLHADSTIQQLVNNSESMLQLTLNGVTYNIDPDNMVTTALTICPQGNIPTEGICVACPPGTREDGGGCVLCATGSYQDLAGSTSCKLCPEGKTTLDVGADDILECTVDVTCPPGTREDGGSCVLCATGSYQDLAGSTSCKLCPEGKTTLDVGADNILECTVDAETPGPKVTCPPGTREDGGSCVLCATGSYQDLAGSTSCKLCPEGKTTLDVGADDILECTVDVTCPPGTREDGGSCVLCETGSYQDLAGSTSCKLCPEGKTTLDVGADDILECTVDAEETEQELDDKATLAILIPCVTVGVVVIAALAIIAWKICSRKSRPVSANSLRGVKVVPDVYLAASVTGPQLPPNTLPCPPPDYEENVGETTPATIF